MSKSEVIFEMDQEILDNIKKTFADKSHVEIGVLGGGKVARVAAIQEFGTTVGVTWAMNQWFKWKNGIGLHGSTTTINVPARSFLRKTVAVKGSDFIMHLQSQNENLLQHIVNGSWKIALSTMGWQWNNYIEECFATRGFGQWAPLASFTVWDKGHDIPLFRTGKLQGSIQYKVVEK